MNKPQNIQNLYNNIRGLILEARAAVSRTINIATLIQNWEIGRMIVEEEQGGDSKAEYGKYIIKELSEKLTKEFGNGYSIQQLMYCRQFFNQFPISHAPRGKFNKDDFDSDENGHALSGQSGNIMVKPIFSKMHPILQTISPQLTWTHYRSLLHVKDPAARQFYMNEAAANNWSTRALDRQINSLYYERLLSSKNKETVIDEMKAKTKDLQPGNLLKDPYILEFLQLKDNTNYRETELEQALINKLNLFLLELGKGFAFVERQKRISTESKHFFIDLVFYNYHLKCFILIDLKTGELTHQDIGQMDMYVRLYEDKYKTEGDNPTIGLILCTKKDQTIVKYSVMNESKQLFASKYMLYLPSEKELKEAIENEKYYFNLNKNK